MTITEIRDIFIAELEFEYKKMNKPFIQIRDKLIALWISEAQQDISSKLKILKTYTDISLTAVTSYTTYTLPSNFGKVFRAEISGTELDIVNIGEIPTTGTITQGTPTQVATYNNGTNNLATVHPLPDSTYTMRLWYYVNPNYYSPSGVSAQDWGTFDGNSFSGNLKIPEPYYYLIKLYLLGKIFDNKRMEYEAGVRREKNNSFESIDSSLSYNLGGYE